MTNNQTENKHNLETQLSKENWMDGAVFYVPANTVSVIWETVFTGQKTQPTVSKYWRDTYSTSITEKYTKCIINRKHNKTPSLH